MNRAGPGAEVSRTSSVPASGWPIPLAYDTPTAEPATAYARAEDQIEMAAAVCHVSAWGTPIPRSHIFGCETFSIRLYQCLFSGGFFSSI